MINKFNDILNPIAELLAKKRSDYGDNYEQGRDKRGPVSFYLRIEDKLNRIEQLDSNPAQVKTESVEDTLFDLIGYCTLEINYRREKRAKELSEITVVAPPKLVRQKCRGGYCSRLSIDSAGMVAQCQIIEEIAYLDNKGFCVFRIANGEVSK